MKKTAIILLTLLIAIAVNSCKKDYPKDIPDWLKDKIKQLKKENPCNDLYIKIEEYEKYSDNKIIYVFTKRCPMCSYIVYDYNGTILCNDILMWPSNNTCGGVILSEYLYNRNIWTETCN